MEGESILCFRSLSYCQRIEERGEEARLERRGEKKLDWKGEGQGK